MRLLKWYKILSILVLLVFAESCSRDKVDTHSLNEPKFDSLDYWIKLSKEKSSSDVERITSVNRAYAFLQRSDDTIKHKYLSDVAKRLFPI